MDGAKLEYVLADIRKLHARKVFYECIVPVCGYHVQIDAELCGLCRGKILHDVAQDSSSEPDVFKAAFFQPLQVKYGTYVDERLLAGKLKEGLKMIQYKLYQLVSSATEAQTATLSEAIEVTSTPEVLQAACIMFTTLPIICIYPFLQKYFVKGVMVGAVKG